MRTRLATYASRRVGRRGRLSPRLLLLLGVLPDWKISIEFQGERQVAICREGSGAPLYGGGAEVCAGQGRSRACHVFLVVYLTVSHSSGQRTTIMASGFVAGEEDPDFAHGMVRCFCTCRPGAHPERRLHHARLFGQARFQSDLAAIFLDLTLGLSMPSTSGVMFGM
ncbi:uncharacterized protein F5Z01DRAFT_482449 [Emericellopsis atlantica]|uniref:Uncharacterized protein n=1 Tax=Emericellopsis atlantica TaxID=2614577 RepID=A0A9P8CRF6_9HYPO|nr:uncharacterized protein F5Z01DRAFT_482449 [Emericellopsis atlantica]KAG9256678.1 hypothetical protein F5Z01DRAFT_482449 [Emericellopsis atlantica]